MKPRAGMPAVKQDNWKLLCLASVLLYLGWATLLAFQRPGVQYDEALLQHGAVHLLTSSAEPPFAHDQGSWVSLGGRYWPLMTLPYQGAVQHYVLLGPFILFGPSSLVARLVSALLTALGIWGISRLVLAQISGPVAAALSLILAVHPSLLVQTVFNNGGLAFWMASVGMACVALDSCLRRRSAHSAVWLGLTLGLAVWSRLNFVWFLASVLVALLVVLRQRLLALKKLLMPFLAGVFLGSLPLIVYEFLSGWATVRFVRTHSQEQDLIRQVPERLFMLLEVFVSDGEYRAIWSGSGPLPLWQLCFVAGMVLIGTVGAPFRLLNGKTLEWGRVSVVAFAAFLCFLIFSKLGITQHHLVTVVPLAAVGVTIGFHRLLSRWRHLRLPVYVAGIIYVLVAFYWNIATVRGIGRTGGSGHWSDAMFFVSDYLCSHYENREIRVLDWGLYNSLFVISNAKIQGRELFWGATVEKSGLGRSWSDEIHPGKLFLTNADGHRVFTEASKGFYAALAKSGYPSRRVRFFQRTGSQYAELVEVLPFGVRTSSFADFEEKDHANRVRIAGQLVREEHRPTGASGRTRWGSITAAPNPVLVCDGSGVGVANVTWTATGVTEVEVHVDSPNGPLFSRSGPTGGTKTTAKWVRDGTTFYLQDTSGELALAPENTLATVTLRTSSTGCP